MKTLSIVIPTMKRDITKFEYISRCVNTSDFNFQNELFIFLDKTHVTEIDDICGNIKCEYIYRNDTDELYKPLSIWNKKSYEYWSKHLCLDFVYSMEHVLNRTTSTHYMWLEDDTIISPKFKDIFQNDDYSITNYYHDIGFCCMVFEKSHLIQLIEFIKLNYMKNIPLDFMLKEMNVPRVNSTEKCAFHIGEISSRLDNNIIRKVDI